MSRELPSTGSHAGREESTALRVARPEAEALGPSGDANAPRAATAAGPVFERDFSRVPARAVTHGGGTGPRVGSPGDTHEREADRAADAVMSMSSAPHAATHAPTHAAPAGTPQAKAAEGGGAHEAAGSTAGAAGLQSSGSPLPEHVRSFFEPRFGSDFSRVRVHADESAAASANALNASAYTLGRDIVFGAGEYRPETSAGRKLLAHELAHVVQQGGSAPLGSAPPVNLSADGGGSSALQIRRRLRASQVTRPTIQRVATWGGDYTTDRYKLQKTPGLDGVDIALRFKPNKYVNAELIGMVQTARSTDNGVPVPASTFYTTAPEQAAFEGYRIPAKEANAGTMIDRVVTHGNPLYATDRPAAGDTLGATGTVAGWGQHGWRFKDKAGTLQKQDALLIDTPALPSGLKKSRQVFESTALAVKGVQEGTFYGSVQWGWEKDATGKVNQLPLTVVSDDVPSAVFARATEFWNPAKTSEGKDTLDLPIVTRKFTHTPGVWLVRNPSHYKGTITAKLSKNTRLEVTDKGTGKPFNRTVDRNKWWKVTIVEGTHIGKVGWVMQTLLSDSITK